MSEVTKAGSKFVRKQYYRGRFLTLEEENGLEMEVHTFESPPAQVEVTATEVKNLGNYESLHLTVGITLPCYPEEKDDCRDHALKWVKETIEDQLPASIFTQLGK